MLFNEQSYGNGDREQLLETSYENKVLQILQDAYYANDFVSSLQASISAALVSSIPTVEGNRVDYSWHATNVASYYRLLRSGITF